MSDGDDELPVEALEDVAYLSRSANRVRILEALTRGDYGRRDLVEVTGASRATLDRIVNELEERGWARRTVDGGYTATATGEHLVDQLLRCIESVETVRRLGEAVGWLPADELSIGLHHFGDAFVRRPAQDDPMETIDYFTELVQDTDEFRVLSDLAPPVPLSEAMHEGIVGGWLHAEYVVADEIIEYIRGSKGRRKRWKEMIEGGADMFRCEGPVPCNMYIFDDVVMIKEGGPEPVRDSYGVPIQSENDAVVSWAHELIDRERASATRVDAGDFAD